MIQEKKMTNQHLNDRYEIIQQLGKRTGRETLLARDLSTQNQVVIKILKFSSEFEWDDLKLFEREAQILQHLNHPAIPQYLDFFEFEVPQYKGFALVQTYIEAKSLEQHRQAGRTFTEDEVKQIAEQLLEILGDLHDRHPPVIHRDLKPSNILLGDRSAHTVGKVYLVDFGSVQNVAATEGGTFTVVGTYGYMPPEQFGGRTVPASDLYSLGATLMYLLTGKHPADLPQKNFKIDIAKVTKLSPGFKQWLENMLEPSLDRRFNTTQKASKILQNSSTSFAIDHFQETTSQISVFRNSKILRIMMPTHYFATAGEFPFFDSVLIFLTFLICSIFAKTSSVFVFSVFIFAILIKFIASKVTVDLQVYKKHFSIAYRLSNILLKYEKYKINKINRIKKSWYFDCLDREFSRKYKQFGLQAKSDKFIAIYVGNKQYKIQYINQAEANWLGYELSEFLDLPLEYYYRYPSSTLERL